MKGKDGKGLLNGDIELYWNCFTCSPPAKKKGLEAGRSSTAASRR